MHLIHRAYIRQPSGLRFDLLDPRPDGWTDEDLAIGLSRTFRWGGHSVWPFPLSVAQHSLTVLALYKRLSQASITRAHASREMLHDAEEGLMGGFDPISPLKPFLGPAYAELARSLQQTVFKRYGLVYWTPDEYKRHKRADNLAAASEAMHVAGWSADEVHDILNIGLKPLTTDPLAEVYDCRPWEPWTPNLAAARFLSELTGEGAVITSTDSFHESIKQETSK